ALDVVHGPECQNLPPAEAYQVRQCSAFDQQITHTKRRFGIAREYSRRQRRVGIRLAVGSPPKNAMQAGNHPHREPLERIVFPAAHDNELVSWNPLCPREVISAFRSDDRRPRLTRNIWRIERMVVMGMRDE